MGQRCFYWREAAGPGPRIRWKGPATVVLVESQRGPTTPPTVYWLVHGTALIRAAPEHVRPDLENATLAADTPALHDLVRKVQNRGTTVYIDLFRTNRKRRREDLADTDQEEGDQPPDVPPPPPPGPPVPQHQGDALDLTPTPTLPSILDSAELPSPVSTTPTLRSPGGVFRPRGPPPPQLLAGGPPAQPQTSPTSSADAGEEDDLAEAEDPDSEEGGDDDPDVDPDTDGEDDDGDGGGNASTSSTTAPSTADRPGTFTGASTPTPPSNSETRSPGQGSQHRLHPIFEEGADETLSFRSATFRHHFKACLQNRRNKTP